MQFSLFAMERQLKTVGQKPSQHSHLLVQVGPGRAGCFGDDIEVFGIHPRRTAGDRFGIQIVGGRYKSLQCVILRCELMGALHPDPPARCAGKAWLDGCGLKFGEAWPNRSGLGEHAAGYREQNRGRRP